MDDMSVTEIEQKRRRMWLPAVMEIWEEAVHASHTFLSADDIAGLKPWVQSAATNIPTLAVACAGGPAGFMGVGQRKIEMMFIRPEYFRRGIGAMLVRHAVDRHAVISVDCNEQNPQALAFYSRMGFRAVGRTPVDAAGNPFPIVHLRLAR